MVWDNSIFQKKKEWFYIFNIIFSSKILLGFLNHTPFLSKQDWFWYDSSISYIYFFKKQINYNYTQTTTNYSDFFNNFNKINIIPKNCISFNSNKGSNEGIPGKINFFDVNNNIFCINSYYLQNFLKIKKKKLINLKKKQKNKKTRKFKTNNKIFKFFYKITKKKFKKHKKFDYLLGKFKFIKIINYKLYIKSFVLDDTSVFSFFHNKGVKTTKSIYFFNNLFFINNLYKNKLFSNLKFKYNTRFKLKADKHNIIEFYFNFYKSYLEKTTKTQSSDNLDALVFSHFVDFYVNTYLFYQSFVYVNNVEDLNNSKIDLKTNYISSCNIHQSKIINQNNLLFKNFYNYKIASFKKKKKIIKNSMDDLEYDVTKVLLFKYMWDVIIGQYSQNIVITYRIGVIAQLSRMIPDAFNRYNNSFYNNILDKQMYNNFVFDDFLSLVTQILCFYKKYKTFGIYPGFLKSTGFLLIFSTIKLPDYPGHEYDFIWVDHIVTVNHDRVFINILTDYSKKSVHNHCIHSGFLLEMLTIFTITKIYVDINFELKCHKKFIETICGWYFHEKAYYFNKSEDIRVIEFWSSDKCLYDYTPSIYTNPEDFFSKHTYPIETPIYDFLKWVDMCRTVWPVQVVEYYHTWTVVGDVYFFKNLKEFCFESIIEDLEDVEEIKHMLWRTETNLDLYREKIIEYFKEETLSYRGYYINPNIISEIFNLINFILTLNDFTKFEDFIKYIKNLDYFIWRFYLLNTEFNAEEEVRNMSHLWFNDNEEFKKKYTITNLVKGNDEFIEECKRIGLIDDYYEEGDPRLKIYSIHEFFLEKNNYHSFLNQYTANYKYENISVFSDFFEDKSYNSFDFIDIVEL